MTTHPDQRNSRILIVDDDPSACKLVKTRLNRAGYEVLTAPHAAGARELVQKEDIRSFDAVVLDYRMPGENGLELLAWFQCQDPTLRVIMMTAEKEKDVVTGSLRGGACDFIEKPIDFVQLSHSVAGAVERTHRHRYQTDTTRSAEQVGQTQYWMVQAQATHISKRIRICFHPRRQAGGDFVNVIPLDAGRFLVMVADVSGHDLKAAFMSAYFQGVVRGMAARDTPVQEILGFTNRLLLDDWNERKQLRPAAGEIPVSLSVCSALVDLAAAKLSIANHGMPSPMYVDAEGRCEPLWEGTVPLGWLADHPTSEVRLAMSAEACLGLWTDGLEEVAVKQGVSPATLAHRLLEAGDENERKEILEGAADDVLVVWVDLSHEGREARFRPLLWERYEANTMRRIDEFQAQWERSLLSALPGVPLKRIEDVLLCAREAVLNGLEHGCAGQPGRHCSIQMSWCARERLLRVRVDDPGSGFKLDAPAARTDDPTHGDRHLGLVLIRNLADQVSIDRQVSSLAMDFRLG